MRGQKEIHEKQCQGPNSNPKARTRLCMPVVHTHAEVNPGMRKHAVKSGRSREISAVYSPTRENTAPASGAHIAPLLNRNKDHGTNCAPGKDNNLQGGRIGFIDGRLTANSPRNDMRHHLAASKVTSVESNRTVLDPRSKYQGRVGTMLGQAGNLYVGDRVEVNGRKGTVMFIGPAEFAGGNVVAGLRLDEKRASSECDGKYNGERLFRCKAGFGLFVPLGDVKKINDLGNGDEWEPLPGNLPHADLSRGYDPFIALESLIGHEHAKSKIQVVINALQVNRRRVAAGGKAEPAPHVVIAGPAGSGKSLFAMIVARIISDCDFTRHGLVIRASKSDLLCTGRSNGRISELVALQCEKAEGGVLLVDDVQRLISNSVDSARDFPELEAMEALALEVEKRARRPGKGVVLVLAGEKEAIDSLRRMCPQLDAVLPQPIVLQEFTSSEIINLMDAMAKERGFTIAPGLKCDSILEQTVIEAARCAEPTRKNAHLARSLLEQAIDRQTARVFSLNTLGKDSLTILERGDFLGVCSPDSTVNTGLCASVLCMHEDADCAIESLESIVGLSSVKQFIFSLKAQLSVEKERVAAGLPSTGGGVLHMIFAGNPGTGKTTVARIVANLLRSLGVLRRGHLLEADRSTLVAGYSGQTALKTKAVVQQALGGVLFIDEAYSLVSGDRDSFGKEALDTLMKEMEDHREDLVVIAAGYTSEMRKLFAANPGLKSRFPTTLHFDDYDAAQLMKIAERLLEPHKMRLAEDASVLLKNHFDAVLASRDPSARGSNGRGVRNLLDAAKRAQAMRLAQIKTAKSVQDLITLTAEDCEAACTLVKY